MMDEKLAKEKLEDEAGIYFEYTRAKYDDATKVWVFTIANKDGRRVFRASKKEDFAPYIALSRHLKLDFENLIAEHVWIYGDEIEIDFDTGIIKNLTTGESFTGQAFPEFIQKIIKQGGLINYINSEK